MPIQKERANGKTVTCKIKFCNNTRFMASSLSNLTHNLAEGFHKGECKDFKSDPERMTVTNGLRLGIQMCMLQQKL